MPRAKKKIFLRADTPEQKNDRREMMLKAALEELDNIRSADEFTMDSLSRRLGLARGTIYIYFADKYSIFNFLLIDGSIKFLKNLVSDYEKISSPSTPGKLARIFCDGLRKNNQLKHLPQLLGALSKNMDKKNVSLEKEIELYRSKIDELIVAKLDGLKSGDGRRILHYGWTLLLGFSNLSGSIQTKIAISDEILREVEEGLRLVIDGMMAQSR